MDHTGIYRAALPGCCCTNACNATSTTQWIRNRIYRSIPSSHRSRWHPPALFPHVLSPGSTNFFSAFGNHHNPSLTTIFVCQCSKNTSARMKDSRRDRDRNTHTHTTHTPTKTHPQRANHNICIGHSTRRGHACAIRKCDAGPLRRSTNLLQCPLDGRMLEVHDTTRLLAKLNPDLHLLPHTKSGTRVASRPRKREISPILQLGSSSQRQLGTKHTFE